MDTIPVIFENGVFRPLAPVSLPELTQGDVVLPPASNSEATRGPENLYRLLDQAVHTGIKDLAARHNEHQP